MSHKVLVMDHASVKVAGSYPSNVTPQATAPLFVQLYSQDPVNFSDITTNYEKASTFNQYFIPRTMALTTHTLA